MPSAKKSPLHTAALITLCACANLAGCIGTSEQLGDDLVDAAAVGAPDVLAVRDGDVPPDRAATLAEDVDAPAVRNDGESSPDDGGEDSGSDSASTPPFRIRVSMRPAAIPARMSPSWTPAPMPQAPIPA